MFGNQSKYRNTTSTPKRRRLGTGRVILGSQNVQHKPLSRLCESPPIPCNQTEYCESSITSLMLDNNVPKVSECSRDFNDSLSMMDTKVPSEPHRISTQDEIKDIPHEMFHSKLEVQDSSFTDNHSTTLLSLKCENYFRQNIEESFDAVNQSICHLDCKKSDKQHKNEFIDTKDSFLLDIEDNTSTLQPKKTISNEVTSDGTDNDNSFYSLPIATKKIFKSCRNIEKFYDGTSLIFKVDEQIRGNKKIRGNWQEECLNLDALKNRQNLVYALPTSGGKTLVAEVLMMREVINRKRNALFVLPFVAIVQEKIWALSPFAVQLDFLVEEYAGGKGLMPPRKRRRKNSIYIATIEKGLALLRSLIELHRLDEVGLVVVDELHLVGEGARGGTLETLLSTVIAADSRVQVVGMSATLGNLSELAAWLRAAVFARDFRPVPLAEHVKLGDALHRLTRRPEPPDQPQLQVDLARHLTYDYSAREAARDPDRLGALVAEVVPAGACLVFCPTKRNCENVAALLCQMQRRDMASHRPLERASLAEALQLEGAPAALVQCARRGVAYHHAGLAGEERALLETAFRAGVVSVLCCTSTLAAGVNLPARRVIIRAPYVGRAPLSLAAYRQMVGRAGRAGECTAGESIIVCPLAEWARLREVLGGALPPARSQLAAGAGAGAGAGPLAGLLLSAVALRLATSRAALRRQLRATLLHQQADSLGVDTDELCDATLRSLLQCGAVREAAGELAVSALGNAAIKACLELDRAQQMLRDVTQASRSLVTLGALHLLYLVTPPDAGLHPDPRQYYTVYSNLDEEGTQTARVLGITEKSAVRMITGKPVSDTEMIVLSRFYIALILRDLWNQVPFAAVVDKYSVPRGTVQSLMSCAASVAWSAARLCAELPERWPLAALLAELAPRLAHCAAPELSKLMELPNVRKTRALQLSRAGYRKVEQLARADAAALSAAVPRLTRPAAHHLISAARMMLIEKVENLRAEAEDVMEDLKI